MQILSLQSAVAHGHVGNSAAVFALQRLGFQVARVDTVQFSNHPGHGGFRGAIHPAAHVAELVAGLDEAGVLADCHGVLTGYLGEAGSGEAALSAVDRVKQARPGAPWLCDPVMGDDGPGVYVRPGIPDFMRERALPRADILTPNRFELELLAGQPAGSVANAVTAARSLLARGPRLVVATSLGTAEAARCLAVTADGAWMVETPVLPLAPAVNGAGDLLSALLLARVLDGAAPPRALALAVAAVYGVLERTGRRGGREMALVDAQDELCRPSHDFPPIAI